MKQVSQIKPPSDQPPAGTSLAHRHRSKRGLTLIELLVVLVILVGLGGILLPTINNALARTHVSTCAANFPAVHQMMQRVQLEFGQFGTNFDSGIDTGDLTVGVNGQDTAPLSADEAAALAAVGITSVVDHDATVAGYDPTFNIGATQRLLADTEEVITLTDTQAEEIFLPVDDDQKYVWFGIGRNWSLLGNLAPEPPVHFGDDAETTPDLVHSRFGIVMQVADADGALERARFVRVSYSLADGEFETADNHIEAYYAEVFGQ